MMTGEKKLQLRTHIRFVGSIFFVLVLISCTHYPINPPLEHVKAVRGLVDGTGSSPDNSESLLMVVTFSGGGTRAAAFSYGVLEELADTYISWDGRERRLLDEIDMISAVSGGSFTAAYYGLFGERIFSDFEDRFLNKNIRGALRTRLLSPINWFRLASPHFHRSDLAAEYYNKYIFDGGTFADIFSRGTPVVINATNMTLGTRFGFDSNQFNWICSDLSQVSVSRAVAASSAVPVLMSPITLRNYTDYCGFDIPDRIQKILQTHQVSSRQYHQAAEMASYLDRKEQPYIHLLDGGLSDNLGLRAAVDAVNLAGGPTEMLKDERLAKTRKVIFIIVNAQTVPDMRWAQNERSPSISAVLFSATTVPLNRYNFETVALLRTSFLEWKEEAFQVRCNSDESALPEKAITPSGSTCPGIDFYVVEIGFDALQDKNEKMYLETLPTFFQIPEDAVDRLRAGARQVLGESKDFRMFLQDVADNSGTPLE